MWGLLYYQLVIQHGISCGQFSKEEQFPKDLGLSAKSAQTIPYKSLRWSWMGGWNCEPTVPIQGEAIEVLETQSMLSIASPHISDHFCMCLRHCQFAGVDEARSSLHQALSWHSGDLGGRRAHLFTAMEAHIELEWTMNELETSRLVETKGTNFDKTWVKLFDNPDGYSI